MPFPCSSRRVQFGSVGGYPSFPASSLCLLYFPGMLFPEGQSSRVPCVSSRAGLVSRLPGPGKPVSLVPFRGPALFFWILDGCLNVPVRARSRMVQWTHVSLPCLKWFSRSGARAAKSRSYLIPLAQTIVYRSRRTGPHRFTPISCMGLDIFIIFVERFYYNECSGNFMCKIRGKTE